MKKLIVVMSVLAIAVACHKKAVPTVADRTEQPPPPPSPPPPGVEMYNTADVAAGKTIYETKCTRCHGAKPVDNYTEQRWPGILKSMVPKARLDSMETKQVTAYVMVNAKKS
jgi:mono/diheme cytochrome c family protein